MSKSGIPGRVCNSAAVIPSSSATIGIRRPPRSPDLSPDVGPVKNPRSKQHDQFVRFPQKLENVLLKIRPRVDLGLVKEGRRAASLDLPCNLSCYPGALTPEGDSSVGPAVADEDQSLRCSPRDVCHSATFYQPGSFLQTDLNEPEAADAYIRVLLPRRDSSALTPEGDSRPGGKDRSPDSTFLRSVFIRFGGPQARVSNRHSTPKRAKHTNPRAAPTLPNNIINSVRVQAFDKLPQVLRQDIGVYSLANCKEDIDALLRGQPGAWFLDRNRREMFYCQPESGKRCRRSKKPQYVGVVPKSAQIRSVFIIVGGSSLPGSDDTANRRKAGL